MTETIIMRDPGFLSFLFGKSRYCRKCGKLKRNSKLEMDEN